MTHYRVLERFGNYTHIECELETGRTHQIRVHMASIGHPILGDLVYGPTKCPFRLQGQTLHARILGFVHPSTGAYVQFDAPLPEYFEELLKKLLFTILYAVSLLSYNLFSISSINFCSSISTE